MVWICMCAAQGHQSSQQEAWGKLGWCSSSDFRISESPFPPTQAGSFVNRVTTGLKERAFLPPSLQTLPCPSIWTIGSTITTTRFDPWVRKIPWRREWHPTPVLLPGESHGQRSLAVYGPWGHKELDKTEWLTFSLPLHMNSWKHCDHHLCQHHAHRLHRLGVPSTIPTVTASPAPSPPSPSSRRPQHHPHRHSVPSTISTVSIVSASPAPSPPSPPSRRPQHHPHRLHSHGVPSTIPTVTASPAPSPLSPSSQRPQHHPHRLHHLSVPSIIPTISTVTASPAPFPPSPPSRHPQHHPHLP